MKRILTAVSVVVAVFTYTRTTEILWGKRDASATPSKGEHPDPCLDRLLCFSRPLTSKMVLLYYAKVCFGWLSFEDKGEGVAEYIKVGCLQCEGRNGPTGYAPYLGGLAQILGR